MRKKHAKKTSRFAIDSQGKGSDAKESAEAASVQDLPEAIEPQASLGLVSRLRKKIRSGKKRLRKVFKSGKKRLRKVLKSGKKRVSRSLKSGKKGLRKVFGARK